MRTRDLKRKLLKEAFTGPRTMTYDREHRTYRVEMCKLVDKTFKKRQEAVDYIKSLGWYVLSHPERWDALTLYYLLPNKYNEYTWAEACIDRICPYVTNPEKFREYVLGKRKSKK